MSSCAVAQHTPPTPPATLELTPPAYATEKCVRAAASLVASGQTDVFAARQTEALDACDGKRELLVYAIVAHNAYLRELSQARAREYCLATKPWYAPFRSC